MPRGARDSSQRVTVMKQFYRARQAGNRSLFTSSARVIGASGVGERGVLLTLAGRRIEGEHEEAMLRR